MTQTTSWASLTVGALLARPGVRSGYEMAFTHSMRFRLSISALCISQLKARRRVSSRPYDRKREKTGFLQYREGLRYMRLRRWSPASRWSAWDGQAAAVRRRSCSACSARRYSCRADGDRHYLGLRGHRALDRRVDRVLAG
jgi:hypothetical protein